MTWNFHTKHSFLSILLIFIALSGMLGACRPISETPKSTGGVDIELTATLENPVAQELTLVSPAEVMTEMPTITLTPEPSPTATVPPTETPIPTEVEKYPIDLEKLRNFPQSYEYLVAHPKEFVEAPDGIDDPQALLDWYYNKFVPAVGDQTKLEPSLTFSSRITTEGAIVASNLKEELNEVRMDKMMFAYFVHNDKKYAIPVFTFISSKGYNGHTFAIITDPGSDVLENINSDKFIYVVGVLTKFVGTAGIFSDDFVDDMEMMISGGINGSESDTYFRIGVGFIKFYK